jgi:spermidine/putrescine-binding protein
MKKLIATTLFILVMSIAAFAQANEGLRAPARPGSIETAQATGAVRQYSKSITVKLLRVDTDNNEIIVQDVKTGQRRFLVEKDTRIKADKKTELGDKHDIKLADYKEGQTVKLTIRLEDGKLLELRLKETKPDSSN